MITVPELAAEALWSFVTAHMNRRFGSTHANLIEGVQSAARLALECIGNSDALYHNVEHTMLVTLVGYDIMKGRSLLKPTSANDYAHLIVACLLHDIGFVRGIVRGDSEDGYVIDANGGQIKLSRGASDAALMPYHVERSKLFVRDRIGKSHLLDVQRICDAIEFTRFPISETGPQDNEEGLLARAANLIGQLGDPHYLRKANALFYEFEEVGEPLLDGGEECRVGLLERAPARDDGRAAALNQKLIERQTEAPLATVSRDGRSRIGSGHEGPDGGGPDAPSPSFSRELILPRTRSPPLCCRTVRRSLCLP